MMNDGRTENVMKGERLRLFTGGVFLREVRRESIFKCMVNLSILAGTISIVFILSMALILAKLSYVESIAISAVTGAVYLVYRVITETGNFQR